MDVILIYECMVVFVYARYFMNNASSDLGPGFASRPMQTYAVRIHA